MTDRHGRRGLRAAAAAIVLAAVAVAPAPAAGPTPATRPVAAAATPATAPAIDSMAIRREPRAPEASEKDAAPAPQSGLDTTRVVASLVVVLGLIFALKHFGKRLVGPRPGVGPAGVVQVLTRQPLGPRQQIVLLRVGRRVIVVADAAGKMSPLSEITDADEVAALVGQVQQDRPASATKAFGTLLGRANELFASAAAKPGAAPAAAAAAVDDDDEDDLANVESLAVHETRRDLEQLLGRIRGLTPPDRNSSSSSSIS